MKKFFTLLICSILVVTIYAQNNTFKMSNKELRMEQIPSKVKKQQPQKQTTPLPETPTPDRNVDIVDIIDIGTSANAFTYWKNLSYLWVDPVLNTVTNIHRMGGVLDPGGDSGDLGYDISKDGGMTWVNMNEIYISKGNPDEWSFTPVRYPQGGIYNPLENDQPDNAYVAFFSPCVYDIYPPWTYVHGAGSIGNIENKTYSFLESNDRFYQNVPLGFDITSNDQLFVVDENTNWTSDEGDYRDSLIITKGAWDEGLEDFIYIRENLEALVVEEFFSPVDYKIAFGTDGQTGYIVMLADNGEAEQVEGFKNLYPIYWKTTDAGETWVGPEVVQLDGPNGLVDIIEGHLSDTQLEELFGGSPPPRNEISYTTAFDCEIVVDKNNRLHIAIVIGPTGIDPYSIVTASNFIKAYDIFMYDENETFCGVRMGSIRTFRGTFGEFLECDNRIQITTNPDHDLMFISWLDTDLEEEEENRRPNIWCRGLNPTTYQKTVNAAGEAAPTNVTNFSAGMCQAYFATAPKYTFEDNDGFTLPYVYIDMDPTDEMQPVQFKYIQNFRIDYNDWEYNWKYESPCSGPVGQQELTSNKKPLLVLDNYPNPFKNETTIQIELYKAEEINLTVISITGQQLFEKDYGQLNQGKHDLSLQINNLSPGIYFYTVTAGSERVTKKMVIE